MVSNLHQKHLSYIFALLFCLKRNNVFNTGFVIFVIVSSFFSHTNQIQLDSVAYGSTSESTAVSPVSPPPSPLGSVSRLLVDQAAFMISIANPSVNNETVKEVVERLALQTQGKGGNAEQSLVRMIEQISQNSTGPLVSNIINLALMDGNTQPPPPPPPQQPPIAPQAQEQPPIAPQAQEQQQQPQSSVQPTHSKIVPQQNPETPEQNVTGQETNQNVLNDLRRQGLLVDDPGVCYTQGDLGIEPIDCEDLRGEEGESGRSGESDDDESESE